MFAQEVSRSGSPLKCSPSDVVQCLLRESSKDSYLALEINFNRLLWLMSRWDFFIVAAPVVKFEHWRKKFNTEANSTF